MLRDIIEIVVPDTIIANVLQYTEKEKYLLFPLRHFQLAKLTRVKEKKSFLPFDVLFSDLL